MVAKDTPDLGWMTDPWDFGVGGIINAEYAPPGEQPFLVAAANKLFLTYLAQAEKDQKKAERMFAAIDHFAERQNASLRAADCLPTGANLRAEVSRLRQAVHKRLPERICLGFIVSALINPPFAPYQIPLRERQKDGALERLADDLGVPRSWIQDSLRAVNASKSALKMKGRTGDSSPVTLAGVNPNFAFLARPVAAFFAPEGPASTEGLLAGLLAVGEITGVLGGALVITAVGAAPQEGALAVVLIMGPPQKVEGHVLLLHATAFAKFGIRPGTRPRTEVRMLEAMLDQLETERIHRETVDVRSGAKKDLEQKLKVIKRALDTIESQFQTGHK